MIAEAIAGILKYSPDDVNILRRKILTREILFSYLNEKNITIRLPATKNDLIDRIIEYWQHQNSHTYGQWSDQNTAEQQQICEIVEDSSVHEGSVEILANQFSKWFYTQMNTCGVEPLHFFNDAKLKLSLISNEDCDNTFVDDPIEITNTLQSVKNEHNLYFNPNFSQEGVQGRIDPHGLVMVLVCGTLHIQETMAGVFEQVFALARDPFSDNNWKIKHTELVLRNQGVTNKPRLCDGDLTSDLLALPSN